MTKNNELFTTMPVGKAVAKLAIPTVVSQMIVILYSLADTFFIVVDWRSQPDRRSVHYLSHLHPVDGRGQPLWHRCQ